MSFLEERLARRRSQGNLRQLRVRQGIDFASNDYLGLARLALQGELPVGSTGSRLLTGHSLQAEAVEEEIAAFHGFERALLFSSGYMANLGLLSAVAQSSDLILADAAIHASTRDGIILSRAASYFFRHNDLQHLQKRLQQVTTTGNRFVCVESIYSTDGSRASLQELARICDRWGAHLIVDEAHSVGLWGPSGRGWVAEAGLTRRVFAQVVTFGKALGAQGAAVLGSSLLREVLINFSRPLIYTTALPPQALAAISAAYARLPELEPERRHLRALIAQCQGSDTQIQSLPVPGNGAVKRLSERLLRAGFDVRPLTSPTVRRGQERLRISLHAFNTREELTRLWETMECNKSSSQVAVRMWAKP